MLVQTLQGHPTYVGRLYVLPVCFLCRPTSILRDTPAAPRQEYMYINPSRSRTFAQTFHPSFLKFLQGTSKTAKVGFQLGFETKQHMIGRPKQTPTTPNLV